MAIAITTSTFAHHATLDMHDAERIVSDAFVESRISVAEGTWEVPVPAEGFWLDRDAGVPAETVVAVVVESRLLGLTEQNELPPYAGNMEVTDFYMA